MNPFRRRRRNRRDMVVLGGLGKRLQGLGPHFDLLRLGRDLHQRSVEIESHQGLVVRQLSVKRLGRRRRRKVVALSVSILR